MGVITCPRESSKHGIIIWLVKEAWCKYCKFYKLDKCIYKEKSYEDKKHE